MRISNSAPPHTETLASPFLHGLHTRVRTWSGDLQLITAKLMYT